MSDAFGPPPGSLIGKVVESPDGDPAKRGTVTQERALRGGLVPESAPPPPDHPAYRDALLVPPSSDDLGLVTARSMDEALRKGR